MLRVLASVILLFCAIESYESNAAVLPSVTPVHQQGTNPSPIPAQQLRFPAGRTKNGDPNTESEDYSICFPYFISQDIESLLAQAIRMLDRIDDGRQKSWLRVFVQKLDSLSRQLQSLPVKHRNMCFQKNHQQNLQSEEDEEEYSEHPVEPYPGVIPDDVQLQNARNFFDGPADPPRQRNGHEQYITGKVFDRMHPSLVQRHSTKRFHVEDHNLHQEDDGPPFTEPVHAIGTDVPKSRESEEQNGRPAIPASIRFTPPLIPSDRDDDAANPLDREMVPVGSKPVSSMTMTYENMPFLPRSTRKGMPRQLVDKLRYHPHQSRDRENDLHTQQLGQQSPSPPTTTEPFLQSRTLVGPDDVTNGGTAAGDHNHRQHINENNHEQAQHPSDKRVFDSKLPTGIGNDAATEAHPKLSYEDDEIVNQLHSDAEAMRHEDRPDRKITDSSIPMDSRVPLTRQQAQMLSEAAQPEQHITNSEEHRDGYPRNYGKYDYRQIPYHYDNNNLDFEYEDQGAAAGELYAEEDNNSARLLAVPPSPKVADNNDDDAAVRQLHELKSSNQNQHQPGSTSSNNQMQTSQAYPTETSKLEQRDVEGH